MKHEWMQLTESFLNELDKSINQESKETTELAELTNLIQQQQLYVISQTLELTKEAMEWIDQSDYSQEKERGIWYKPLDGTNRIKKTTEEVLLEFIQNKAKNTIPNIPWNNSEPPVENIFLLVQYKNGRTEIIHRAWWDEAKKDGATHWIKIPTNE